MNYLKNNYKNLLILLIGVIILSFGSSIIITANMGSDSITVFSQGLANILKIKYGYAYIIGNTLFFIFMIVFHRKRIGVGTIISAFSVGLLINLFLEIIPFKAFDNLVLNFSFALAGLIIVSIGLALYMYSNTGLGAFEAFVDFFSSKLKIKFGYVKIAFDAILFITGILLGGTFGIISVVSIIILGPLIDFFGYLFKRANIIDSNS